jgi:hypothetical protein
MDVELFLWRWSSTVLLALDALLCYCWTAPLLCRMGVVTGACPPEERARVYTISDGAVRGDLVFGAIGPLCHPDRNTAVVPAFEHARSLT